MSIIFSRTLYAGWGDMDANGHMRNTAYLDKSADLRMMFFAEHGFPVSEFQRLRFGPAVKKDEIVYYREFSLLDEIRTSLRVAGQADDGSRFKLQNDFHRADGQLAASVISIGGWLDREARRLRAPPPELLAVMNSLPKTEGFEVLPSSVKKDG